MEMKFCQSCGMPLTENNHGTNADGSLNEDYCCYCYQNGEFTRDMTMEEMIEFCSQFTDEINKNSGQNLTPEDAKNMMRKLFPGLKRWQSPDILKQAEALLACCCEATFASVNSDGYPRPVPMSIMKTVGCNEIWLSTGDYSEKTKEFRANPKAGLCYTHNGDSVVMRGEVEIVKDDELRKEMWVDWMIDHFPGGPTDPGYVLLRFVGKDATLWIDNQFVRLKL